VPKAEKTTDGVGVREERAEDHFVVSGSTTALSLGPVDLGLRRERVLILDQGEYSDRQVERMWAPTRPVEPITAAVGDDILTMVGC
jgi:hypothetical protein